MKCIPFNGKQMRYGIANRNAVGIRRIYERSDQLKWKTSKQLSEVASWLSVLTLACHCRVTFST